MSDHPLVTEYLRELRRASRYAPTDPREALLEDIAAHLRATVAPNATDEHARRLLVEFGSPDDLVTAAFGAPARTGSTVRERRWLRLGGGVALVVVVVVVVLAVGLRPHVQGVVLGRAPTGDASGVASVLDVGPRTAEGRVYVEYAREIVSLPPLPPGAAYPEGVPAWSEPTEPVVVETGIGTVIADFTWLCLWESEYLVAYGAEEFDRVLDAEQALRSWIELAPLGPESLEGWSGNVLVPLQFDDPAGVRADRPEVCGDVGIAVP